MVYQFVSLLIIMSILDNFSEIKFENPVDKIIRQIKELVSSGYLKPGDRLPPERKLAEKIGVSRSHIREAIRKLEFYGIVKTLPQSGTFVSSIGIVALEGLMTDVLKLEQSDFASLVETRVILEVEAARLAAERRTAQDLEAIQQAMQAFEQTVKSNISGVTEDLNFHFKIAEASHNTVLKSLMKVILPDIVSSFTKLKVCDQGARFKALEEHQEILRYIKEKNASAASNAMNNHLHDVLVYSKSQAFLDEIKELS